jgi:hypothetical protein
MEENTNEKKKDIFSGVGDVAILNLDNVMGLIRWTEDKIRDLEKEVEEGRAEKREIYIKRRSEIMESITELSVELKIKYGYTFDKDRVIDTLYYIGKTDFADDVITVYYWKTISPLAFKLSQNNFLLVAPQIIKKSDE